LKSLWIKIGSVTCCLWLIACSKPPDDDAEMRKREIVTYHDRNADGKVDLERHRYLGYADADWELRDDNFDGRFEARWNYGVGLRKTTINVTVPTNVTISPEKF
jgi:hypothetical protein